MKQLLYLALGTILACNSTQNTNTTQPPVAAAEPEVIKYATTITQSELKDHLYIYASDEFEGRETGKPGQKKASEYIKDQYEEIGVEGGMPDGTYFQKVPLEMAQLPTGKLVVDGQQYEIGEDFLTFDALDASFEQVVYAGYGIETDNYSDFKNIDVTDKVVLIKSGEPVAADGSYMISGSSEKSVYSNMSEAIGLKAATLQEKGAQAILYYDPDNYARFKRYYDFMETNETGRMAIKDTEGNLVMVMMTGEMAEKVLPGLESDSDPRVLDIPVDFKLKSSNVEIDSENVVAIIKGKSKPDEYVVISSHLDHIGITADGNINNGADDDGSGTVAMLEIAEAFKESADAGAGPDRSVVFLHVTGEEKGLLGSQFYTDVEPLYPLEHTIANLNIDMIGRIDPKREGSRNYIYLIGSDKLSSELHQLSEDVNEEFTQVALDYTYNDENDPNRFYYRSDHYNFAKNNIPIIFYFNGTHADYHRPSDTPDKINYDLLQNRARLIFHTAWELANRDKRVVVDKVSP